MVKDDVIVKLTNRNGGIAAYTIPDLDNLRREFASGETKEVSAREVRKLASSVGGGLWLLQNCFSIDNDELISEILHSVEPEYKYTSADVAKLVASASIEEFLDALDFAPESIVYMIRDEMMRIKCPDLNKRNAIKDRLNFDITQALMLEELSKEEAPAEPQAKRRVAVTPTPVTPTKPARRVVTEK